MSDEICSECGTPGGKERDIQGVLVRACDRCHHTLLTRAAMDAILHEVAILTDENSTAALSLLDRVYSENKPYDHDGWLERSVKSHRAMVLAAHARYAEAEAEIFAIPSSTLQTAEDHAAHRADRAWILELRGRYEDALEELDRALALHTDLAAPTLLRLLCSYAAIAQKAGAQVPMTFRSLLEGAISELGIPALEDMREVSLGRSIEMAARSYEDAGKRYERVIMAVQGKPMRERASMMNEYARTEPVGFFRDMARRFAQN